MHAINLLAMGKTVVATAKSLDIGVSTLHRWKATHPLFKAELALRQHNLFDAMIQKLRLTMGKAIDALFDLMTSDSKLDRKEVMFALLKLLRPQKFLVPNVPMTASAVLDEAVRGRRASQGECVTEEITEQERIAAIPAEFLTPPPPATAIEPENGHAERSEASGPVAREGTAWVERQGAPSESIDVPGQILRGHAQDDGLGAASHAEHSEVSCPVERQRAAEHVSGSSRVPIVQ
jgi:hypothetical protein